MRDLNDFWQLEMSKQMTEWNSAKLRKYTPPVFYILTLISRALSRDNILQSIMDTADHFREIYSMHDYEALEHAVSKRRSVIRDKLALSAKDTESGDGSDWEFDINGNS